ncbi:magnesium transporter MgtE [bacterium BMS3Bbin09]|nr:magnesium transporter MgtE [bacterium BMS3Bbin09]
MKLLISSIQLSFIWILLPDFVMIPSMELMEQKELIEKQLEEKDYPALKESLQAHPAEIAELMNQLDPEDRTLIFRLLSKDIAVEVFEHIDSNVQSEILSGFHDAKLIGIVDAMSPDDRARLIDELPALVVKKLRMTMTPQEWNATSTLLGYAEDTAGRMMTPEFVDLKDHMTVREALKRIRRIGKDSETIYYLYVTDVTRHLLGAVSLRRIVLSESDMMIRDIMDSEVIKVSTDDDQEAVAGVVKDYDFLAVPVVDKESRLVGIITVDDIIDVMEEEATEDILKSSGVAVAEKGYFESSLLNNFSKRIGWLVLLLIMNTLSGTIILANKELLATIVALSAFMPILIGTGGNTGSQSATVVIRGLAVGEIEVKNAMRILFREILLGVMIGLLLGAGATLWAYWLQGDWMVSIIVGLSFVFVMTVSTTLGTFLPFVVKRIGFDPALIATPLITTTIDVTSLLIYFKIAALLIGVNL